MSEQLRSAKISISRTRTLNPAEQEQYGPGAQCIWIEVLIERLGEKLEIEMSLDAFAYAITGAARQPGLARIVRRVEEVDRE